jgi:hypothetical protein
MTAIMLRGFDTSVSGFILSAAPLERTLRRRDWVEEGVTCSGRSTMGESHPRGTLAIVAVLGAFFALGWLAMFLFLFLERGAPQP